jgi:hypothetical protein
MYQFGIFTGAYLKAKEGRFSENNLEKMVFSIII